ncbi:zinc finger protein 665-like [Mytilus californianus]|uniref:zinc finger protein 665-like n=1 Tax=Mytilus californianus TaxID=6549 RepID=UPI0022460123|nr:zinc finger protein 665-like [Mytilus californianus]
MDLYTTEITSLIEEQYGDVGQFMNNCLPGYELNRDFNGTDSDKGTEDVLDNDFVSHLEAHEQNQRAKAQGNNGFEHSSQEECTRNTNSSTNSGTRSIQVKSEIIDDDSDSSDFEVENSIENQSLSENSDNPVAPFSDNQTKKNMFMYSGSSDNEISSVDITDDLLTKRGKSTLKMKLHICKECGKVCRSPWKLMTHVKSHNYKDQYECPECGVCKSSKKEMKNHFRRHANLIARTEKSYKCDICDASFYSPSKLKTHMCMHNGIRPYTCGLCNKSFTWSGGLRDHLKIHTGERPHTCKFCSKTFPDTSKLKNHQRIHTGEKPHVCTICGKGFIESGKLKRHMRTHTGEQPYKCDLCDKRFNVISNLNKHMTIHSGEKPYVCNICGRGFSQNTNLKSHSRIHTGEKDPYKCEVCDVRFERIIEAKMHACSGPRNVNAKAKFIVPKKEDNLELHSKGDYSDTDASENVGISELKKISMGDNSRNKKDEKTVLLGNRCVTKGSQSSSLSEQRSNDTMTINTSKRNKKADVIECCKDKNVNTEKNHGEKVLDDVGFMVEVENLLKNNGKINEKDLNSDGQKYLTNSEVYKPILVFQEYPCQHCGKVFHALRKSKIHEKIHSSHRPFVCNYCGKTFIENRKLSIHLRIHTNYRPFPCTMCDKKFTVKSSLEKHIIICSGQKPYECTVCGRRFAQTSNLSGHMRVHNGELDPKKCGVCRQRFKRVKDAKNHPCPGPPEAKELTESEHSKKRRYNKRKNLKSNTSSDKKVKKKSTTGKYSTKTKKSKRKPKSISNIKETNLYIVNCEEVPIFANKSKNTEDFDNLADEIQDISNKTTDIINEYDEVQDFPNFLNEVQDCSNNAFKYNEVQDINIMENVHQTNFGFDSTEETNTFDNLNIVIKTEVIDTNYE